MRLAKSPEEARQAAQAMLGYVLVTKQTGPAGRRVGRVYVEAGCDIKRELYLSLLVDRETSRITIIASTEGGMEIEDVAENAAGKDPARRGRSRDRPLRLPWPQARISVLRWKASSQRLREFVAAMYQRLHRAGLLDRRGEPLVVTGDGEVVALDAKISFDDNALLPHPDLEKLRDEAEEDPKELEAADDDLNYIALDGTIGCMVNGAGLAMATMDIIKLYGGSPPISWTSAAAPRKRK